MLQEEIKNRLGTQIEYAGENNYDLWLNCYRGEYPWIGGNNLESLNLAASISSELARLTTIEFKSKVDNEKIESIYQSIIGNSRRFVEYGLALGGIILKPYINDDKLMIDYVTPDMYVILEFFNFGDIKHIVFIDRVKKTIKDKVIYYTRLEEHKYENKGWTITNTAYESESYNNLGNEIPLTYVDKWEKLKITARVNAEFSLFSYFKNPQANNLDLRSNEGVSCFSRALSLIQDADEQYQRIIWEFQGSELAIDADVTVIKSTGELPQGKERLFRNLGLDQQDGFYKVFSPEIRDSSLFNGLNKILRRIEFTVGLAYGTLSEVDEVEKSATEIQSSKQRSYSTVVDIQKELQKCLEHLLTVIGFWTNTKLEASFDFDDSLIVDAVTEQRIRIQEVSAGLIRPEDYLIWRYGVTETEAKKMLPQVETDNEEDDIE